MTGPRPGSSLRWLDWTSAIVLLTAALFAGYRFMTASAQGRRPRAPYTAKEDLGAVPELGLVRAKSTAVVVLSPSCQFCKESLPLYRELSDLAHGSRGALRVVFVASSDATEIRRLLLDAGIDGQQVVDKPPALRVGPVPMVIIADATGKVAGVWIGLLQGDSRAGLLAHARVAARS